MKLKKHDFVEVEYTGKLENGVVFDTTDAKTAAMSGIKRDASTFGPVTICLGEGHILKAIDEKIMEHGLGDFKITIQPEGAFGKKNAKLLKLVPMKVFMKEKIMPYPGLEVNLDNTYGIVRSVSGGRVIVDFNHPLSGHVVKYDVKTLKTIESTLDKAKAVFKNELNFTPKLELAEGHLVIDEKFPEEVLESLKKRLIELVPELKDVSIKKHEHKEETVDEHKGHTHKKASE
ncbi:MAG: hypothetical protein HGA85_04030 [Nanoarchaeota archaeon]|nr:hypothetical protein [Nanoarchaeota archaeon]